MRFPYCGFPRKHSFTGDFDMATKAKKAAPKKAAAKKAAPKKKVAAKKKK